MLDLVRDRGIRREIGGHRRVVFLRERDGRWNARRVRRRVGLFDAGRREERVEEFLGVRDEHLPFGELAFEAHGGHAVADQRHAALSSFVGERVENTSGARPT